MATASGTHRDGKSIFRSASIRAVSLHFIVFSALENPYLFSDRAVTNLNTGTIRAVVDRALAGGSHELTGPRCILVVSSKTEYKTVQRTLNVRVCKTHFSKLDLKMSSKMVFYFWIKTSLPPHDHVRFPPPPFPLPTACSHHHCHVLMPYEIMDDNARLQVCHVTRDINISR